MNRKCLTGHWGPIPPPSATKTTSVYLEAPGLSTPVSLAVSQRDAARPDKAVQVPFRGLEKAPRPELRAAVLISEQKLGRRRAYSIPSTFKSIVFLGCSEFRKLLSKLKQRQNVIDYISLTVICLALRRMNQGRIGLHPPHNASTTKS
jgi:hypothetical protein